MIIAVIGNNGTGKTTIAKEIKRNPQKKDIMVKYKKNLIINYLNISYNMIGEMTNNVEI